MNPRRDETAAPLVFNRKRGWQIVTVLLIASSLHVVPQLLTRWIDPALSMIALMVIDALVFAAVVRSTGSIRVVVVLVVMFVVVYVSRQQNLVALPSIALNLLAATVFGVTLRAGRTPMIHAIAAWAMEPEPVTPEFARYLRRQTQAWMIFFLLMALTCFVLAAAAPFEWWSLFANVLSWPLIGAFFCGEYLIRRTWFRNLPDHTPLQTIASALAYPAAAMGKAFDRS